MAAQRTMTFYIDGACPFCRWAAKMFRRALALDAVPIVHAQDVAEMHARMVEHNSWIVATPGGDLHYGFDAIVYAVSRSWLSFLAPVLRGRRVTRIGEWIYKLITVSRPLLSRFIPANA